MGRWKHVWKPYLLLMKWENLLVGKEWKLLWPLTNKNMRKPGTSWLPRQEVTTQARGCWLLHLGSVNSKSASFPGHLSGIFHFLLVSLGTASIFVQKSRFCAWKILSNAPTWGHSKSCFFENWNTAKCVINERNSMKLASNRVLGDLSFLATIRMYCKEGHYKVALPVAYRIA